MLENARVYVIEKKGRKSLYLMAHDPLTNKRVERSARTQNRREAKDKAAEWQAELREGFIEDRVTWEAFKEMFLSYSRMSNAEKTTNIFRTAFGSVDRHCPVKHLSELTTLRLNRLQERLHGTGISAESVKCYLRHIRAALRWAHDQQMLSQVPKIRLPKGTKGQKHMKGRAITAEEFDRIIEKTPAVIGEKKAESWTQLLRGLWWSGLRLGEALSLTWDEWGEGLVVDTSGRFVQLRIPADGQKSRRDAVYSVAPEFADMLLETPEDAREGFVFNPIPSRVRKLGRANLETASKTIARIGRAAGVITDRRPLPAVTAARLTAAGKSVPKEKVTYATAHDFRRAFAVRWSQHLMPAALKEVMRHASIETTMKYYVGSQADLIAEQMYRAKPVDSFVDSASGTALPLPSAHEKTP